MTAPQGPKIPSGGGPKGHFGALRQWVYPAKVQGRFQRLHRIAGIAQMAIFFGIPWLHVRSYPLMRLDINSRHFYLGGQIFAATDSELIVLGLLFLAFCLFFFTALFGRLWCGYLCPQSVFLEELIRPIESLIEGDRGQRMLRDAKGRWTPDWIWRKIAKISAFSVVALASGLTFVSYFVPATELWTGQSSLTAYGTTAFFSGIMLLDFAWFREQFCNYLCPYARFQGALTDQESLVIAYDWKRGEPRGSRKIKETGACIDCKKCVTVCPQGIDIRNGFQLECISCARCVDACTGVLGKLDQPSLITYTTAATMNGQKPRMLRPRTVVYAGIILTVVAIFGFLAVHRHELYANVNRAPGTLYMVDSDGWIRNTFMVRITNDHPDGDHQAVPVTLSVEGMPPGSDIRVTPVDIKPEETAIVPLILRVHPDSAQRTIPITVTISASFDTIQVPTTFKSDGAIVPKEP